MLDEIESKTVQNRAWKTVRCWAQQTEFFVTLDRFSPFPCTLWTQKIKILKKWKKHLKILSFYKCVPHMTVIWCMVPEIWSMTNRIFCHFRHFLPFYPHKTPKNRNFEKMKKKPRDIIILHKCNKNDNHMIYGSWDMLQDRQKPKTNQKMKILKKQIKYLEILSFCTCVPYMTIIWCMVSEIWSMTDIFYHFGPFFALLPFKTPENPNFEKLKKKGLEIFSFYTCVT